MRADHLDGRPGSQRPAARSSKLRARRFNPGNNANYPRYRPTADACRGLGFLGLVVDDDANERSSADRVVSPPGASGAIVVVAAREDLEIAGPVRTLLGSSGGSA